jgi:hypothetical protein
VQDAARALAVAAVAGGLSFGACFVGDGVGARWGAGLVFGALVLAPSQRGTRNQVIAIALSTAVYRAAVWLAHQLHVDASWHAVLACVLAGVAGAAVLSLSASAVLRARSNPRATILAATIGGAAGALIGFGIDAPDESAIQNWLLLAGFVTWQLGYTAAHHLHPWSRSDARPSTGG